MLGFVVEKKRECMHFLRGGGGGNQLYGSGEMSLVSPWDRRGGVWNVDINEVDEMWPSSKALPALINKHFSQDQVSYC